MWTPNGTIADEQGNVFKGRKAIEEQYTATSRRGPGVRMQIAIKSIDFPSTTTAIEDGVTQLLTKDSEPPSAARYTAVQVQEDGKWLMASVREAAMPIASNFARLPRLGWLVGDWEAKSDGVTAHSQIRWIANKSFLQRTLWSIATGCKSPRGCRSSAGIRGASGLSPGPSIRPEATASASGAQYGGLGDRLDRRDGRRGPRDGQGSPDPRAGRGQRLRLASVDRKLGNMKVPDVPEVVFDRVTSKW